MHVATHCFHRLCTFGSRSRVWHSCFDYTSLPRHFWGVPAFKTGGTEAVYLETCWFARFDPRRTCLAEMPEGITVSHANIHGIDVFIGYRQIVWMLLFGLLRTGLESSCYCFYRAGAKSSEQYGNVEGMLVGKVGVPLNLAPNSTTLFLGWVLWKWSCAVSDERHSGFCEVNDWLMVIWLIWTP